MKSRRQSVSFIRDALNISRTNESDYDKSGSHDKTYSIQKCNFMITALRRRLQCVNWLHASLSLSLSLSLLLLFSYSLIHSVIYSPLPFALSLSRSFACSLECLFLLLLSLSRHLSPPLLLRRRNSIKRYRICLDIATFYLPRI